MNNVYHTKGWLSRSVQIHMYPPPTHTIKSDIVKKLEKYYVKIKLRRNTTLEIYDMYEFKMAPFDNVNLE